MDILSQWNITQKKKRQWFYWCTQQYGWIPKIQCRMKEVLHEEVCTGTIPFILSAKTAKINLW